MHISHTSIATDTNIRVTTLYTGCELRREDMRAHKDQTYGLHVLMLISLQSAKIRIRIPNACGPVNKLNYEDKMSDVQRGAQSAALSINILRESSICHGTIKVRIV